MKHLAIVILALSTFTACGKSAAVKSAADQLAEQKMEAVNSVCEEEAQTLLKEEIADQPRVNWAGIEMCGSRSCDPDLTDEAQAKATGQTVAQFQQAYYKYAKQNCVTRRLLSQ